MKAETGLTKADINRPVRVTRPKSSLAGTLVGYKKDPKNKKILYLLIRHTSGANIINAVEPKYVMFDDDPEKTITKQKAVKSRGKETKNSQKSNSENT